MKTPATLYVTCSECGDNLSYTCHNDSDGTSIYIDLEIEPCQTCLDRVNNQTNGGEK